MADKMAYVSGGRTSKQAQARATIPMVTGRLVERSTTRKDARRCEESLGATLTREVERSNNLRSLGVERSCLRTMPGVEKLKPDSLA